MKPWSQNDNHRQKWILRLFMAGAFLLILRLAQFSILEHVRWKARAEAQIVRTMEVEPARGRILASDGRTVLADTEIAVSIASDNYAVKSTHRESMIARRLANLLDLPMEVVMSKLFYRRNTAWIKRDIPVETFLALMRLKGRGLLPGIHIKRELHRVYPRHPEAAQIIGFTRGSRETGFEPLGPYRELVGVEGLEKSYDELLRGRNGRYRYYINRFGEYEPGSFRTLQAARSGDDLITTLDMRLQRILAESLEKAREENLAASAMGIIMDPHNGDILACGSSEALPEGMEQSDLQRLPVNCWPPEARRNLAMTVVFEPGSIWKPIVMSIALENGLVFPGETIHWTDGIRLGRKIYHDWRRFPPELPLADVLVFSSNIGIIQVSKRIFGRLSHPEIAEWFHRLGFRHRLPADYPVRPAGLLSPERWSTTSVGALAEGYEVSVTLSQLARFYAGIANGGYQVIPHFGKVRRDPVTGEVKAILEESPALRMLSPETAGFIRDAMIACVDHGTGRKASLADYGVTVAGKTATAKLAVNGLYRNRYRASFAGFFPAEDPAYVMVVSVEDPRAGAYYGGAVAAPLFREIASRICEEIEGLSPVNDGGETEADV